MSSQDMSRSSPCAEATRTDTISPSDQQHAESFPQKRKAPSASPPPEDSVSPKRIKSGEKAGDSREDATRHGEELTDGDPAITERSGDSEKAAAASPIEAELNPRKIKAESPTYARRDREGERQQVAPESRHQQRSSRSGERRTPESGPSRRHDFSLEEKKRGQRLFGGLLSTLSQKTNNTQQQRRRQEVEKRQQEKAQQRRAEDDKRRSEKLTRLDRTRKIEQVKFDEQVMRARHSSMIAMAHSLKTESQPTLYYRPWELTKKQEEVIRHQIHEAEATSVREAEEFEEGKKLRLAELGVLPNQPSSTAKDATDGEPQKNRTPDAILAVPANRGLDHTPSKPHGLGKDRDDHRDVVVETEEDVVIY